jgi:hypothetical protein
MIYRGQLWGTLNISAMPWKTSLKNSHSDDQPLQIRKNRGNRPNERAQYGKQLTPRTTALRPRWWRGRRCCRRGRSNRRE